MSNESDSNDTHPTFTMYVIPSDRYHFANLVLTTIFQLHVAIEQQTESFLGLQIFKNAPHAVTTFFETLEDESSNTICYTAASSSERSPLDNPSIHNPRMDLSRPKRSSLTMGHSVYFGTEWASNP